MKGRVDNGKSERIPDGRTERRLRAVLRGTELPCSGARDSADCHPHNAAQVLIAVGGRGYYQIEGQEPKELKAGQAVCIPADTKHWHGAAPGESCSHLAFMVPAGDPASMSNEWLEPVDAEAYGKLA